MPTTHISAPCRIGRKITALAICATFPAATPATAQVVIGGVNQGPAVTLNSSVSTTSFVVAPNPSAGTLTVTNGSTLTATSDFARVGGRGQGTLVLDSASTLTIANGVFLGIAQSAGSTGTLNASGAGTTIHATGFSGVGQAGTGTLNLADGAVFNGTRQLSFGTSATGIGHGYFTSGATLNASGGLHLAAVGSSSAGNLLLDGANTRANVSNWLIVGGEGAGAVTIQNGARATLDASANLVLAVSTGSTGTLTIDGAGSALSTTRNSIVGQNGTGAINLSHRGVLSTGGVEIGADGVGNVSVSGGASIKSTGTNNGFLVGSQNGGSGSLTISGSDSTAEALGSFFEIGFRGTGTAVVENGGTLIARHGLWVGEHSGAHGALTVKDAGSSAQITDYMSLGMSGSGTVSVENGAKLELRGATPGSVSGADLGRYASGNGTLTISGAGSLATFAAGSIVNVGNEGNGALNIAQGGMLEINGTVPPSSAGFQLVFSVGTQASSHGSVTIDGAGSTATISGNAYIGDRGTGSVSITNGGKMIIDAAGENLAIAESGGNGTLTIDGAGSQLHVAGSIDLGHEGAGRIDVRNRGFLFSAHGMAVGNTRAPGVGQLDVTSGGSVQLGVLSVENGIVTIDGGTLATSVETFIATGGTIAFNNGAFSANTLLNSGLLTIDTRTNDARSIYGTVQNHDAGYIRTHPDGPVVNSAAGEIHVQLDTNATIAFHDAVTNSGLFKVTQKAGTTGGNVYFHDTFTNHGTYLQDPTTSHFTDLINNGSLSAGPGDRILASGQVLNHGTIDLAGSHLGALGGIHNLGTISIFDTATIDGPILGAGSLVFHVLGDDSHLTLDDPFFGGLQIVFDNGYSPVGNAIFLSFLNGVSFTHLTIGGRSFAPGTFDGAGSLLLDGSFIRSNAVPEPSTYAVLGAFALLACMLTRHRARIRGRLASKA